MPIVVNTNTSSLFAQRALGKNAFEMQRSIEKLSTGSRINRAGDDAAGLSISEGMTSDIRGFQKAKQNVGDGISLIQTAEGALGIVQDNMQRVRELLVQGINGTNSADEADAIQREINERVRTIDDIAKSTKFNGIDIIYSNTASAADISLQTGANNSETTTLSLRSGVSTGTGIDINIAQARAGTTADFGSLVEGISTTNFALNRLHLSTATGVNSVEGSTTNVTATLTDVDVVINNLSRMRSYLGAKQNSLESKSEYLDVAIENSSAARSRIKDVDVASESSHLLKNQILQQAAATMLTQANATPQLALNLLP
jgi:flagellin